MPKITISSEVVRSPRVLQLESIFALPPSARSESSWDVTLDLPTEWSIGLVVGPSGSGKTTLARELFKKNMAPVYKWDAKKSLVDDFPKSMPIKEITTLLSSVGFSSPHAWIRPFGRLSNGEQFRVSIARTLAEMGELVVIDEFSSVVDRTVAKIASAAVAKTVRKRKQKLIALSCHYDIMEWLEPDWVYQPHTNEMQTGRHLWRRPTIPVTVKRVHYSAWKLFGRFHYLDSQLNKSAFCFCAFIDDQPVGFCAVISFPHAVRPGWRFHRLVCLPDYQGIGVGSHLADYVASIFAATGKPVFRTLAHPAVIHACLRSKVWETRRAPSRTSPIGKKGYKNFNPTAATRRLTAGFEYIGPALAQEQATAFLKVDTKI